MIKTNVNPSRCKGCGLCASFCPKQLIEIDKNIVTDYGNGIAVIKPGCIGCGSCYTICPDIAIEIQEEL